jgi:phosphatidylserine/phosphatidylglycerophosphate/cardiolipin synthase-like enzyme
VRTALVLLLASCALTTRAEVVLHEIAWAGGNASGADEWIELLNPDAVPVVLDGWRIEATDLSFRVDLAGVIEPGGLFLLERADDDSVPCAAADLIYDTGEILGNGGLALQLIDDAGSVVDEVDAWHAGDAGRHASMERVDPTLPGTEACNWRDGVRSYCGASGLGTPGGSGTSTRQASVVFNEIAWAGTDVSASSQWIELRNRSPWTVDLDGWSVESAGATVSLLGGRIEPGELLMLESDESSVRCAESVAQLTASLEPPLLLLSADGRAVDRVDAWHAGVAVPPTAMERVSGAIPGVQAAAWTDAAVEECGGAGLGTPGSNNPSIQLVCPGSAGPSLDADLRFAAPLDSTGPESTSDRPLAAALLPAIEAATTSVWFALHEVRGQDAVLQALLDAQARGVDVRCVLESGPGQPPPADGEAWSTALGTCVWQDDGSLMHHKFFVIDGARTWTGSTNVTETGLGGEYNHNASILVDSAPLAAAFEREHEEMWAEGLFSTDKSDDTEHVFCFDDDTRVELYFSPSDAAMSRGVLPVIREAQSSLDVAAFFLTSVAVAEELRAAHVRGVRVRVLMDAVGAASPFSAHPLLCDAGIPVRIENWGGKEHLKACVADSERIVLGSMNWTASGDAANDENTLVITSPELAWQFRNDFEGHWNVIGDRFDCSSPGAETLAAGPFACTDGIDNDFDGFVDAADSGCDPTRETTEEECTNGVDDDGDGFTDAADWNCSAWWPDESSIPACNDGLDQDGDGFIDADDFDCAGKTLPRPPEAGNLRVRKVSGMIEVTWDAAPVDGHSHLLRAEPAAPNWSFRPLAEHFTASRRSERSRSGLVAYLAEHAVDLIGDCGEPLGEVVGP